MDPKVLPVFSSNGSSQTHFYDHHCHILKCVAGVVEVDRYWFIREFAVEIRSMAIHAQTKGVLRFSHVLLSTLLALN